MEKTIDKETLLKRTMWGVDIYAHILRKFYPDETVIKVVGRDCGICKNPFAGGARTLHIWFERNILSEDFQMRQPTTKTNSEPYQMEPH